ncbi:hypothetical protein E2C01_012042 [Portunus trituberculatus]|uniref:Uncharacterized protein n=1 Tax=Portunus trituberculatus TaxID=210409 RepID=A0A5B7DCZ1_PORTR|nr:hypothetical protein [Portunus trituberculatus]
MRYLKEYTTEVTPICRVEESSLSCLIRSFRDLSVWVPVTAPAGSRFLPTLVMQDKRCLTA